LIDDQKQTLPNAEKFLALSSSVWAGIAGWSKWWAATQGKVQHKK
jgi:hypothetical protein